MSNDLLNQLKTIISEKLDVNLKVEEIDENASLFEDGLGIDSIAIVTLLSLLEKQFDIQFSEDDLTPENFSNLNLLTKVIANKINSKATTKLRHKLGENVRFLYIRALYYGISYSDLKQAEQLAHDLSSWSHILAGMAANYNHVAQEAWNAKHWQSAMQLWQTTVAYYHYAQRYCGDEKQAEYVTNSRQAYHNLLPLLQPKCQKIAIPFEDTLLPGYMRIFQSGAPLVILIGGIEASKEVELHKLAETFLQRGMSVVYFDGPGMGEIENTVPMRIDFEIAVSAVIDFISQQKGLTSKIGIFGFSLGAYLAARATAMDDRIAACISLSGFFDGTVFDKLPPKDQQIMANKFRLNSLEKLVAPDTSVTLKNLPQAIKQPFFIIHGGGDVRVPMQQIERMQAWATGETRLWVLKDVEHICISRFNEVLPIMGDWMAEKLEIYRKR
ncbi:MAG TPA: alpha/beta fold hydrolase [Thioploca sp.]|nr:alpha/beta fold hydrolase [Thioploca sp.]